MSAIERETSEYVEMSDSITLCIVKDGAAGTSINMKTGVSSPDALPSSGASVGDSYIIDGHLWTYTGGTASDATHRNGFTDCGKVSGEAGKNNYVHVAWSNRQQPTTEDDIVLSNTDGNTYAYMGTWVSETKEDKADEAVKMAKWVYVKGDKGADGSAYDIYLSASVLKGDSTGKLNGNDTVRVTAKVVKIIGGTAVQVTDTNEAYFTISRTEVNGDLVDGPSGSFTVKTFNAFGQGVKTWNFALYVGGTFLKTVTLPVVRDGKQGADGKGALEIVCDPETITLDTDDNGLVKDYSNAWAALMCVRDGKVVGNVTYKLGKTVNCEATVSASGVVTITSVGTQSVAIDGSTVTVSSTSGSVTVNVTEDATGVTYTKTVPFAVNVAKFNGGLKADNKTLKSQYTELSNNAATKEELKQYDSKIEQTARNISLKVMEKSVGRRNLLPGSAFRKQYEGCYFVFNGNTSGGEGIVVNDGIDGVNALKVTTKSTVQYSGVYWGHTSGSPNIKIKRNAKYTASVWVKCSNTGAVVAIEMIHHASANEAVRHDRYGYTRFSGSLIKAGEWQLLQLTVSTGADYDYTECNFWATSANGTTVLFCKPMLEEGDEYNGWTLSEQDYDYIGGNLLDGTGKLVKTGNVEVLNSAMVTQGGMGESASIRGLLYRTAHETDFLQYSTANMGLKANEDYVLSFYARTSDGGSAGLLQCYLYPSNGNIYTEDSDGKYDNQWNSTDGDLKYGIVVGTQWKRYWVHWRPTKNDPQHVLFRLLRQGNDRGNYSSSTSYAVGDIVLYDGTYYKCKTAGSGNTPSSSSSYWEAREYDIYISQPKLEVGATMTEWTEKRSDMVDKQALYATGIDIDLKKITLTADNTTFRGNDGKELAKIDRDGLRVPKMVTTDTGSGHTVISGNITIWYQKDGVTPGIKVFYDAAGVPHFQFCNSNGKVMYDFGPSGLQSFISSTQNAYSDVCYLRDASSHVKTNTSGVLQGFSWCYVARNQSGDLRYIYRKQIPTTPESSKSEIYDGCVFTSAHKYEGTDWPAANTTLANGRLLADGWYVEPNDGNLPMKLRPADEEGVLDPTQTLYYQTFYYYSSGKVTRTVRAYMKKVSDTQVSKFEANGDWDEI